MKKFLFFISLFLISSGSFAQWTEVISPQFVINNECKLNTFVDANGVHMVYWRNGGIKYARLNSAGTVLYYDKVIESEGSNCDFANIVSVNNNYLYAIYKKNNTINVKRSVNLGNNWSQYSYRNMTNTGCDKVIAYNDVNDIHIGWTENKPNYGINSYYIKFTPTPSPNWTYYKEVTDVNGSGGDPDLTISPDKIHYTYSGTNYGLGWRYPESRDRIKTSPDWQDPMDIPYLDAIQYKKSLIANEDFNVVFREEVCFWQGCNSFITYVNRPYDQGYWNDFEYIREIGLDTPIESESTVDNKIHFIFFDKSDNVWEHRYLSGSTLSDPIAEIYLVAYPSPSLVANSNDLYLMALGSSEIPSYPLFQHYDVAPLEPTGLTIREDANHHPQLDWNVSPEPDRYRYYIYCFDSYIGGGWYYLDQSSSNSYTDQTRSYCHAIPPATCENYRNVSYRVTVVDNGSHESSPSNEVTARLTGGAPQKISIKPDSEIPLEYSLAQNYPNPFNPTTTIAYSIKTTGLVTLKVYDMLGMEVSSLVNETKEAGNYSVVFDASNLPSGIYFYTLTSGNPSTSSGQGFTATKKLILLK